MSTCLLPLPHRMTSVDHCFDSSRSEQDVAALFLRIQRCAPWCSSLPSKRGDVVGKEEGHHGDMVGKTPAAWHHGEGVGRSRWFATC
uniref:Uncharacterized protein n=1 Tax=Arundo donax TaxID=35708 RepID=A0A0A9E501_ARUDO